MSSDRRHLATQCILNIRDFSRGLEGRWPAREDGETLLRGIERMLNIRQYTGDEVSNELVLYNRLVSS